VASDIVSKSRIAALVCFCLPRKSPTAIAGLKQLHYLLIGEVRAVTQTVRGGNFGNMACAVHTRSSEMEMATGTVKWFNPTKGYGSFSPQEVAEGMYSFNYRPLREPA